MKSRVVMAVAVLCGLFLLVSAIGIGWMGVSYNRRYDRNVLVRFEDSYRTAVQREMASLNAAGRQILDAGILPSDWHDLDVSSVRDTLSPVIERITFNDDVVHFTLYTPDRQPFVRINSPESGDSTVYRASLVKALRTGNAQTGIELDGTGRPVVHSVIPLITDGKPAGMMEIGKYLDDVIAAVAETSGVGYVLRLNKRFISRERWQSNQDVSSETGAWERLPRFLVLSSSLDEVPYGALRREVPVDVSPAGDVRYFDFGSSKYASTLIPIADQGSRHVGDVVTIVDTSMLTYPDKYTGVSVFVAILVATALGFLLVSLVIDRTNADAVKAYSRLQERSSDTETRLNEQLASVKKLNFKLETQRDALNRTTDVLRHKLGVAENELDNASTRAEQIETVLGATRSRLAIIDGDYEILYVDPATHALYGSPANRKCHEYFMQRAKPCTECAIGPNLEPGMVRFSRQTMPRERRMAVHLATAALATAGDTPIFAELRVDVTASHRIEQELIEKQESLKATLERSREMLEAILNATADGILAVNTAGDITHSSSSFSKMWNTPRELLDKRDSESVLEHILGQLEEPEEFQSHLHDLFRTLCNTPDKDIDTISFKDGRVFERSSTPIMNKDTIAGRVWSFRDITARAIVEQERMQKERLQGVLELAGAACHEFNQPLQAISGYAELLAMKLDEDNPMYKYVQTIRDQVAKMSDTTRKPQSIARYETQEYVEGAQIIDIEKSSGP